MVFHSCKQWTAHKAAPLDVCLVTKHLWLLPCFCFAFFGLIIRRSSSLLSCPSSLLSSSSLYDDYCLSFSLKVSFVFICRLGRFEVFEDDDSCLSSCFFSFVFTRLHRDDGIAVAVVVVLAVFSDCFSLFVFRVIVSSCLFVRSFVFVLVSRGRGGVPEGLGKKRHQKKKV
jgi:hypothetical protein